MSSLSTELFNKDAEEALVGAILINPGCFPELDVKAEHFHIHRLRWMWEAFDRLYQKGYELDFVTLTEELERAGKLEEVGGVHFLSGIVGGVPNSYHAQAYASLVKEYAQRRAWQMLAGEIARLAMDKDADLNLEAGGIINKLTNSLQVKGEAVHIRDYTQALHAELSERAGDPQEIWGIPTGFLDFDNITGGLQEGEILYISGEPGIGKSILAAQMGFQMAEKNYPGAIYSLEMPGVAMVRRRVSHMARIPVRSLKTGNVSAQEWIEFTCAVDKLNALPLYMSDTVQWSTSSLRADLSRLKAQHGIRWFVLDYAYLLQDGRGMSENDRTGFISSQLKAICRGLGLAGVIIHSLNKGGMGSDARVGGEHLRGSGQQFYDADLLLFLVKSEMLNFVTCVFGKGRELENPKQGFELMHLPGYPAFVTPVVRAVKQGA